MSTIDDLAHETEVRAEVLRALARLPSSRALHLVLNLAIDLRRLPGCANTPFNIEGPEAPSATSPTPVADFEGLRVAAKEVLESARDVLTSVQAIVGAHTIDRSMSPLPVVAPPVVAPPVVEPEPPEEPEPDKGPELDEEPEATKDEEVPFVQSPRPNLKRTSSGATKPKSSSQKPKSPASQKPLSFHQGGRQREVLAALKKLGPSTSRRVQEYLNCPSSGAISGCLSFMKAKGLVKYDSKTFRYRLA